jgi:hypothetical protein
VEHQ